MTKKFALVSKFRHFKIFRNIHDRFIWHQIWNDRPKLSPKKLFWCWWRQLWRNIETLNIAHNIHAYFTQWIFQLWCKISETNAMYYNMSLKISYIENFSLRIYLQNWLWYLSSIFKFVWYIAPLIFLARDIKLNMIGDQDIDFVS